MTKITQSATGKYLIKIAALNGFSGVLLGAFGAHALKERLSAYALSVYQTGVQYQMIHALALLGVGALALALEEDRWLRRAGNFFGAGIGIFSGSLYLLALTGTTWWGAITPLGGLSLIVGWLCLLRAVMKR